jgi:hypothetical protein
VLVSRCGGGGRRRRRKEGHLIKADAPMARKQLRSSPPITHKPIRGTITEVEKKKKILRLHIVTALFAIKCVFIYYYYNYYSLIRFVDKKKRSASENYIVAAGSTHTHTSRCRTLFYFIFFVFS